MLLRIDDIHVHYGRLAALRGVSVEVAQGEIVCIVGPNGAGKSTLLLAISSVLNPTSGSVTFDGETLNGTTPEAVARKGISLVPEGRHVFGMLTVEENLRVGTGMRGDKDRVEADFEKVLDQFPILKERLKSPAGKLSGGEQQMLVIGRALLTRPKLMTVDEPSLGLAPKLVDQVYEILTELRETEGLTLLIVEQSTKRAVRAADRVYVLRSGRIELEGSSADLADGVAVERAYFGFGDSEQGKQEA